MKERLKNYFTKRRNLWVCFLLLGIALGALLWSVSLVQTRNEKLLEALHKAPSIIGPNRGPLKKAGPIGPLVFRPGTGWMRDIWLFRNNSEFPSALVMVPFYSAGTNSIPVLRKWITAKDGKIGE